MTNPVRIQLSRDPGWQQPENTVVVTRRTKWGNPFLPEALGRRRAFRRFHAMLKDAKQMAFWRYPSLKEIRSELHGKNLACWCRLPGDGEPDLCHAAILLEIAKAPEEP